VLVSARSPKRTSFQFERLLRFVPSLPKIAQLRESFTDRWSKAPANEKPAYQAAVVVCRAISQSIDEREKAISSVQSSSSVHGSVDLGAHRKDRLTWTDQRREEGEERNRKDEAAQKDRFLNAQLQSQLAAARDSAAPEYRPALRTRARTGTSSSTTTGSRRSAAR
jgi:hypothetical protein